jgi:hypothetical protein
VLPGFRLKRLGRLSSGCRRRLLENGFSTFLPVASGGRLTWTGRPSPSATRKAPPTAQNPHKNRGLSLAKVCPRSVPGAKRRSVPLGLPWGLWLSPSKSPAQLGVCEVCPSQKPGLLPKRSLPKRSVPKRGPNHPKTRSVRGLSPPNPKTEVCPLKTEVCPLGGQGFSRGNARLRGLSLVCRRLRNHRRGTDLQFQKVLRKTLRTGSFGAGTGIRCSSRN